MPNNTATWRERIAAFEGTERPRKVDRAQCGWNTRSQLFLAEAFISEMGLGALYAKFLDQLAEEELTDVE